LIPLFTPLKSRWKIPLRPFSVSYYRFIEIVDLISNALQIVFSAINFSGIIPIAFM
jgi:hypothetical protein